MKAAVMYSKDGMLQYADVPEPVAQEDELLITMKAAAIKHIDKSRAKGEHYSTKDDAQQSRIIGGDGVGILPNGKRVYAINGDGMIAEKAVVDKNRLVPLPDGIDDVTAAALPNAVIGSAMGLLFKAGMQGGETVLINGATGFTGKIAVQVAKHYGAKKIIITGRNEAVLQSLLALGADEVVSIQQDDAAFVTQIKAIHNSTPIDIIIDYLWGHSAELMLAALKGRGMFTHKTRFVSIGAVTGDVIQLSAEVLRSTDLLLTGSGLGSWSKGEVQQLFTNILPEMFELAADGKLKVDTVRIPLQDVERVWDMDVKSGERLVVVM